MTNSKLWSSGTPGLLIVLLDQSSSMGEVYCNEQSKAETASYIVNKLIDHIICCNFDGPAPRNRCYIYVCGYNQTAQDVCSGWLKELDESPLRIETENRKVCDGTGGLVEVLMKNPIWVEPVAEGQTDMLAAFRSARDLIKEWNDDHTNGPTPIIVNITDYLPADIEIVDSVTQESILSTVDDIKHLSIEDDSPLIYNICMNDSTSLTWPIESEVNSIEQSLCRISSIIPRSNVIAAKKYGITIDDNASCCLAGGSVEDVFRFLKVALSKKMY